MDRHTRLTRPKVRADDVDKAFASLSLDRASDSGAGTATVVSNQQPVHSERELSTIMQAMRKLREALVASARLDAFARDAYVFIIRATILVKHMESYHPALLHLLSRIRPAITLPASELHEFLGYYILDLACRQADMGSAFAVRFRYAYSDERVDLVLKALAHGNWWVFWRMRDEVNEYQRRLIEGAEDQMRKHALACLGRSYLEADKAFVEKASDRDWENLKRVDKVDWELNSEVVMIRRAQRK